MDLARAPRRRPLTARKKGSGYENEYQFALSSPHSFVIWRAPKSSVDIYRIYLRLATISQLTNIRLRQNAKYFAHVNKNMIKTYTTLNSDIFSTAKRWFSTEWHFISTEKYHISTEIDNTFYGKTLHFYRKTLHFYRKILHFYGKWLHLYGKQAIFYGTSMIFYGRCMSLMGHRTMVGNLSTLTKNSGSFLLELPFSLRIAEI
jgi:hypothetical protein